MSRNERYTREIEAARQDSAQLQQQLSEAQAKIRETYEKCGDLEAQVEQMNQNLKDVKDKHVLEREGRTRAEHALKQQEAEAGRQLHIKQEEISHIVVEHRNQLEMKNDVLKQNSCNFLIFLNFRYTFFVIYLYSGNCKHDSRNPEN